MRILKGLSGGPSVTNGGAPLATAWSPFAATPLFVMSLAILAVAIGSAGIVPGLILGGLVVSFVTALTLKAVTKLEVRADGITLGLGPFGLVRRDVPREVAILRARHSFLRDTLKIDREDGHIVGPFLTVSMAGNWPDAALREAGYRFVDPWLGP